MMAFLKILPAICMSENGFCDINSKLLFNIMAGGPLAFVVKNFRLERKQESAINIDIKVSEEVK